MFGCVCGVKTKPTGRLTDDRASPESARCLNDLLVALPGGHFEGRHAPIKLASFFSLADKVVHTIAFLVLTLVGLRAYPRQV